MLRSDVHSLIQLLIIHAIGDGHSQDIFACLLDDRLVHPLRALGELGLAFGPPLFLTLGELLDRSPRLWRELNRLLVQGVVLIVVLIEDLRLVKVLALVFRPIIVVLGVHNLEIIDILIVSDVEVMPLRRIRVDGLPAIPVVPTRPSFLAPKTYFTL